MCTILCCAALNVMYNTYIMDNTWYRQNVGTYFVGVAVWPFLHLWLTLSVIFCHIGGNCLLPVYETVWLCVFEAVLPCALCCVTTFRAPVPQQCVHFVNITVVTVCQSEFCNICCSFWAHSPLILRTNTSCTSCLAI